METAFADVPVTGTASYAGYSSGIATTGGVSLSRDNFGVPDDLYFEFVAEISLTANFGENSVSGTVDNFRAIYYGDPPESELVEEALGDSGFLNDLRVDLGSANISSGSAPAASFFEGTASATTGLDNATGKWGGQFFGTPDAGEAPPAVGGTWGISEGRWGRRLEDARRVRCVEGFLMDLSPVLQAIAVESGFLRNGSRQLEEMMPEKGRPSQPPFLVGYEGRWGAFTPGGVSREDRTRTLRATLFNRAFTVHGFSPELVLVNEMRESNAQLYGYRRNRAELTLVRQFQARGVRRRGRGSGCPAGRGSSRGGARHRAPYLGPRTRAHRTTKLPRPPTGRRFQAEYLKQDDLRKIRGGSRTVWAPVGHPHPSGR